MNLKQLTDSTLLEQTEILVKKERALLTDILHHLREIERRRLYSMLGLRSLFDYAVRRLGYSEDQAYRRIQAMRALKELPELEEKLNSGAVSLTNLSLAQKLFRHEEKSANREFSKQKKLEVIGQLENKSTREAEKILFAIAPKAMPVVNDKIKAVSEDLIELKFTANAELRQKIEKIRGLLAHSRPNLTLAELFNTLCDLTIESLSRKTAAPMKQRENNRVAVKTISAATKRQVWQKGGRQCRNCGSTFALEIDHIKPLALGGTNLSENLRLLCRSCNQRATIEVFGLTKMTQHLEMSKSQYNVL